MNDDHFDNEAYDADIPRPPSKSQRKREATALQDVGAELVKLSSTQLKQIPLSEELLAAIKAAQAITQRGAHKRQLQFIGKLMRTLEEEDVQALRSALMRFQSSFR